MDENCVSLREVWWVWDDDSVGPPKCRKEIHRDSSLGT
jgi:hypothetical protein